ncbi:MAG: ABC-2 family transporter protein [candidate division FCPU426 bacterium]
MGFGVYYQGFRTALVTKLEYRTDFVLGVGSAMGLQAAGLGTLWVVLSHAPSLAGWSGRQVALLFALTTMIQGCSELLFNNVWWLPVFVVRGQIDRLLVYPVKSLPFFLVTSPELHAMGNLLGGLIIFCLAGGHLGLPWWAYAMLPFWVLCGSIVHTAFLVHCCALCFKILGRNFQHFWVVTVLLHSTRYPLGVYPKAFSFLLLVLVPFGAMSFLPIGWSLGRFSMTYALLIPPLAATICGYSAFKSWAWGLKHYESTGS